MKLLPVKLCPQKSMGSILAVHLINKEKPAGPKIDVSYGKETLLDLGNGVRLTTDAEVCRFLARSFPSLHLLGRDPVENAQTESWLVLAHDLAGHTPDSALTLIETTLGISGSGYLIPSGLTVADLAIFALLSASDAFRKALATGSYDRVAAFCSAMFSQFAADLENLLSLKEVEIAKKAPGERKSKTPTESKPKSSTKESKKPSVDKNQPKEKQRDEGKFVDLPGAEMGKVVVRFPPEASGYLHIGHAKAALLNQHYQKSFKGQFILRWDDTNPAKETHEFEQVIMKDVELLQIKPDRITRTSDSFEVLLESCERLLKEGKAYVDDTDPETMKQQREAREESKCRNQDIATNLGLWEEMKKGTERGQQCGVRMKIDMNADNGCMRDPILYRCKPEPHLITGTKYKVYPTYDFACPVVDSIEGVTHALRTMEYHDRDEQYYYILDALGMRKPVIWEYARLNMMSTVMSKRKLTWFVDQGLVTGWDDPRFPTVRGVLRRGMTVEGLKQFILAQHNFVMSGEAAMVQTTISLLSWWSSITAPNACGGSSRAGVTMEWDKIWAFNKKIIDPIAPRFTALLDEDLVTVNVKGIEAEEIAMALHPKNADVGTKKCWTSNKVLLEQEDAKTIAEGEMVTFMGWGNLRIEKIHRQGDKVVSIDAKPELDNKDFKKTLKVTWLPASAPEPLIQVVCAHYDPIINKQLVGKDEDFKAFVNKHTEHNFVMRGESAMARLKKGDIIQLNRKGYYICDEPFRAVDPHTSKPFPCILFNIPDGHVKELPTAVKKAPSTQAPSKGPPPPVSPKSSVAGKAAELIKQIAAQGDKVRKMKDSKQDKPSTKLTLSEITTELHQTNHHLQEIERSLSSRTSLARAEDVLDSLVNSWFRLRLLHVSLYTSTTTKNDVSQAVLALGQAQTAARSLLDLVASRLGTSSVDERLLQVSNGFYVATEEEIKSEVDVLLSLKAQFKELTGQEWSQSMTPASVPSPALPSDNDLGSLHAAVSAQGEKVRQLKADKADKAAVKVEVDKLLALKSEYKAASGSDYDPKNPPAAPSPAPAPPASGDAGTAIHEKIVTQGNKVRDIKAAKSPKDVIKAEVDILLALKAEFKSTTGTDWTPGFKPQQATPSKPTPAPSQDASPLSVEIKEQGDRVRELKAHKAGKDAIKAEVEKLLALKASFKEATGTDWTAPPDQGKAEAKEGKAEAGKMTVANGDAYAEQEQLKAQIDAQGTKVRDLKAAKADKTAIDAEVKTLLALKEQYRALTGIDLSGKGAPKQAKQEKKKPADKPQPAAAASAAGDAEKKQTRLGLEVRKEDNFSEWYSQVITKAEMIDYYDISGCYIIRPWAFAIWEHVQSWFDKGIKDLGVSNCYFPMFVSKSALETEKTHVADFAPEVAWVTQSGDSKLQEPIAVRPTSETVMYPTFARWVQSHRDLPIRINQWCNVVRWEFKHPTPFIRTREFLWQEGHTAWSNREDAVEEVHAILDLYARVYTDLLAIPVIKGKKTEKEKFAGADFTTTIEAYIPTNGRGCQAATSHHLGQNFSKMFNITFEDPETSEKQFAYQNSWGLTTRSIGIMAMIHGDNSGLVLPPRVAKIQVIIVPCGITSGMKEEDEKALYEHCKTAKDTLREGGIRADTDLRDNYSPGWKFNHWELKGVPIRIEIGPRDMKNKAYVAVRRDNGAKSVMKIADIAKDMPSLLDTVHKEMYDKAKSAYDSHVVTTDQWDVFYSRLDEKNFILAPFCCDPDCEDAIKKDSAREEPSEPGAPAMGAKSLCIPFDQPEPVEGKTCIHHSCSKAAACYTLFGRSY